MQISLFVLVVIAVASSVTARGYGPGAGSPGGSYGGMGSGAGGGYGGMAGGGSFGAGGLSGAAGGGGGYGGVAGAGAGIYGQSMAPKPYKTSYEAPDGQGGVQFKTESGDGSGSVQGTYGYRDAQGLYRMVQYAADKNGFKAAVNTNEPGVDGKENPADVTMNVEKTPAGIQEKYTPAASPFGAGPASGFGGRPSGGYQGGMGGSAPGSQGIPGTHGGLGGISSLPGAAGSSQGSSGLFSGIPKSTSGKSAY